MEFKCFYIQIGLFLFLLREIWQMNFDKNVYSDELRLQV